MICKIQPPNPNINLAVAYNEKKMDGKEGIRPHTTEKELLEIEDGHVLVTRNVPEGGSLTKEFARLKLESVKKARGPQIRNVTFHMSVNPGGKDRPMYDDTAVQFIDELMDRLGYAKQPYRVYKHTDIEREHFHVVSTRCGQDGKKIPDSFERLVLRAALKELAPKYGFEVILSDEEKEQEARNARDRKKAAEKKEREAETEREAGTKAKGKAERSEPVQEDDSKKKPVPSFSRKSETPVTQQLKDAFEDTMNWHFSSFEQLQALLLRRYNTLMEVERGGNDDEDRIVLSGTDANGRPITPPLYESDLHLDMLRRINEHIESANMHSRKEQRNRITNLSRAAAKDSATYEDYVNVMSRKGVYVVVSFTEDGKPFGLTYLDRATKCAWKGSETGADLAWLKQTAEQKGWTITKDRYQTVVEKHAKMPSRRRVPVTTRIRSGAERPASPAMKMMPPKTVVKPNRFASAPPRKSKGDSVYDESLRLGEEEEQKGHRRQNNKGVSFTP